MNLLAFQVSVSYLANSKRNTHSLMWKKLQEVASLPSLPAYDHKCTLNGASWTGAVHDTSCIEILVFLSSVFQREGVLYVDKMRIYVL